MHTTPQHPAGTPEYDAYAAALRAELVKFAKGEPPYDIDPLDEALNARSNQPVDDTDLSADATEWIVSYNDADKNVTILRFVRYSDAAASFWNVVASHTDDGSDVPTINHPLALRREGIENFRGGYRRWMVSLNVTSASV